MNPSVSCCITLKRPPKWFFCAADSRLQPHFTTPNQYKRSALSSQLKLDRIPKHILTMSSPLPSEAPTLPVPQSGSKNALSILSKKFSKPHEEYVINDQKESTLIQKLPPQVRTIIWQHLIGGKRTTLRIIRYPRTKLFSRCKLHTWMSCDYQCVWRAIFQGGDDRWWPYPRHLTSLLRTCRLM